MGTLEIGGKTYRPEEVIAQARKAPGILGAIAGFSVVNSVLVLFGVDMMFVIGLGATFLVDAIMFGAREELDSTGQVVFTVFGLFINAVIIGVYLLLWWLARRGSRAAYIVAMVLYLMDGTIFLLGPDWMGVGFHVFFLFILYGGYGFVKRRAEAEAMLLAGTDATDTAAAPPPLPAEAVSVPADRGLSDVLEGLWHTLPGHVARARAAADVDDRDEYLHAALARQGFSELAPAEGWDLEHERIVHEHLAACSQAGDDAVALQFNALALGALLGMHATGELDDETYPQAWAVLDAFVDRHTGRDMA